MVKLDLSNHLYVCKLKIDDSDDKKFTLRATSKENPDISVKFKGIIGGEVVVSPRHNLKKKVKKSSSNKKVFNKIAKTAFNLIKEGFKLQGVDTDSMKLKIHTK